MGRATFSPVRNRPEAHGMGRSRHSVETMRVAIVAHRPSATNLALARRGWNGAQVELLSPREALLSLGRGDLVLGRLDVRDDLDGVEEGLWALERLLEAGVTVLNAPPAALYAHDKLLTARSLRRAGLPHPRTRLIERYDEPPDIDYPAVLKPRFGSWGRDVVLCRDRTRARVEPRDALVSALVSNRRRPRPGADPPARARPATDRRGRRRRRRRQAHRSPREWRTNVALGASIERVVPPPVAVGLACAATDASVSTSSVSTFFRPGREGSASSS